MIDFEILLFFVVLKDNNSVFAEIPLGSNWVIIINEKKGTVIVPVTKTVVKNIGNIVPIDLSILYIKKRFI
jgi:hypothetical protein